MRLDTTVLRLSYDSRGRATGVDLLSGETLEATRAIVSNLTVWDTTASSSAQRTRLLVATTQNLRGWGGTLFLGMDKETCARFRDPFCADGWQRNNLSPEEAQFLFAPRCRLAQRPRASAP